VIRVTKYLFEKMVDLSHSLENDMPVYPGDTRTILEPTSTIAKDGLNLTKVIMSSHAGTHVDSPSHFIENGITIDLIPARKFAGEAVVIDASRTPIGSAINIDSLQLGISHDNVEIREDDFVLFYTRSSELWGNPVVEKKYTFLSEALARELVKNRVRAVGIDSFSVDSFDSTTFPVHKELLSNGSFIIESLANPLKQFLGKRIFLICPPLKLASKDGAPCRCLAVPIME
jgi:arylformamidase